MNPRLIICRGLPASGKSFWSLAACGPDVTRINRDDLRAMAHKSQWSLANEKVICAMRDAGIRAGLQAGHTVIADDTNGSNGVVKHLTKIAEQCKAEVIIRWFPCSVDECIRRDVARGSKVGREVIRKMAEDYPHLIIGEPQEALQPLYKQPDRYPAELPDLPLCIIADMDGTLAWNKQGRSFYDVSNEAVLEDHPNYVALEYVTAMAHSGHEVIIFSGREDSCYAGTYAWLRKYLNVPFSLYMRETGDQRKDAIVKREMYDVHVKDKFAVSVVLDDRVQVVKLWRDLGLQCWSVADGNF